MNQVLCFAAGGTVFGYFFVRGRYWLCLIAATLIAGASLIA